MAPELVPPGTGGGAGGAGGNGGGVIPVEVSTDRHVRMNMSLNTFSLESEPPFTYRGTCPITALKHTDSDFQPGTYVLQAGFVESEIAAASFNINPAEFPIKITGVEMLFGNPGDSTPGDTVITQWAVKFYQGNPDDLFLIQTFRSDEDPSLQPMQITTTTQAQGVHIDLEVDPTDPDQIIVASNASNAFSVGFQILEHNVQSGLGCLVPPDQELNLFPVTDLPISQGGDGLAEPDRNWIWAVNCGIPGIGCDPGWNRFSDYGSLCRPSGDWVIRVHYQSLACAGAWACCLPNGSCVETDEADCTSQGGVFNIGSQCGGVSCQQQPGPCCFPATGGCLDGWLPNDCEVAGGIPGTPGLNCATYTCFPEGACCLPDGTCVADQSPTECDALGGTWQGDGVSCGAANCPLPTGACCILGGVLCLELPEPDCEVASGTWLGAGTVCGPDSDLNGLTDICENANGACCLPDGTCSDGESPEDCAALGGLFQGFGSTCATVTCPDPLGACCFASGFCTTLTEADCTTAGATWAGAGTDCTDANTNGTADVCEVNCPADLNGDDVVNVLDLLDMLSAWGPNPGHPADLNGDDVVNVTDLLDLLTAWGPC